MQDYYLPEDARLKTCCTKDRLCTGSACMAWRWETIADPLWMKPTKLTIAAFSSPDMIRSTRGYCGMPVS